MQMRIRGSRGEHSAPDPSENTTHRPALLHLNRDGKCERQERRRAIADISEFSRERGWKEGMGILQLSCRATSKSLPNNIFAAENKTKAGQNLSLAANNNKFSPNPNPRS